MKTKMYVYTTEDDQGWDHAIYHNNCRVVAVVTGEQEAVEAYIGDNYDDPDQFGATSMGEDMPQSEDCEHVEV